jgi:hypothetical protein
VAAEIPSFDELLELLRVRLVLADALNDSEIHSFKTLMEREAGVIADGWYWEAFEELKAQGHLDRVSHKAFGGDARGRLSADGRLYLRTIDDSA